MGPCWYNNWLTGKGSGSCLFVYKLSRSYQMYILVTSRVLLQLVTSRVGVTSRPPDLRSKGSANLDHYRPRLEIVPSWGCPIVWDILALDRIVLASTVRILIPQFRVPAMAWGISCFLSIYVLPLLSCITSGCVSQRSLLLSSSEMISGPERRRYLQVSLVWVGVRLDLLWSCPFPSSPPSESHAPRTCYR